MQSTIEEVKEHNTLQDCWVVIDKEIYDVTKFIPKHPGGQVFIRSDKDITEDFNEITHSDGAKDLLKNLHVGQLKTIPDPVPEPVPDLIPESNKLREICMFMMSFFFIMFMVIGIVWMDAYFHQSNRDFYYDYELADHYYLYP
jgi:cytochrome b involved in lipid metabolism